MSRRQQKIGLTHTAAAAAADWAKFLSIFSAMDRSRMCTVQGIRGHDGLPRVGVSILATCEGSKAFTR